MLTESPSIGTLFDASMKLDLAMCTTCHWGVTRPQEGFVEMVCHALTTMQTNARTQIKALLSPASFRPTPRYRLEQSIVRASEFLSAPCTRRRETFARC